jgi:hypothetical protein
MRDIRGIRLLSLEQVLRPPTHPHEQRTLPSPSDFSKYPFASNFLPLATLLKLKSYLDFLIESSEEPARLEICSIALHYALIPGDLLSPRFADIATTVYSDSYDMYGLITMLLQRGADPNFVLPGSSTSAWQTLLDCYIGHPSLPMSVVKAFLDAGAGPDALLTHNNRYYILKSHPDCRTILKLCKRAKRHKRILSYLDWVKFKSE